MKKLMKERQRAKANQMMRRTSWSLTNTERTVSSYDIDENEDEDAHGGEILGVIRTKGRRKIETKLDFRHRR
ncbi:hypothetical protein U1Q18_049162, partial [Sarracenia purpurea var. burkii]